MKGTGLIIYFIVLIAVYVYSAYCLMRIAQNDGQEYPWFAWIPILNIWLICQLSEKDPTVLWFILCLVPCVNIVVMILLFMAIAEKLGFESWWGILMIVPIVNFYVLYRFAFTGP